MSSNNNNNKQFAFNQLIWIVISIGISLAISRLLPFPMSIVAIIGVFIMLGYFMRKRTMRKMGMRGGRTGMFDSMSRAPSDSSLKYYCMSCGTQHKQTECPKCGSKLKRVGSWSTSLDARNQKEKKCTALVRCSACGSPSFLPFQLQPWSTNLWQLHPKSHIIGFNDRLWTSVK
jgi:hypothetical protein